MASVVLVGGGGCGCGVVDVASGDGVMVCGGVVVYVDVVALGGAVGN